MFVFGVWGLFVFYIYHISSIRDEFFNGFCFYVLCFQCDTHTIVTTHGDCYDFWAFTMHFGGLCPTFDV